MAEVHARVHWYRAPLLWILLPLCIGYGLADWSGAIVRGWLIFLLFLAIGVAVYAQWKNKSSIVLASVAFSALIFGNLWFQLRVVKPDAAWASLPAREVSLHVKVLDYGRADAYGRTHAKVQLLMPPKHLQELEGNRAALTLSERHVPLDGLAPQSTFRIKAVISYINPTTSFEEYLHNQGIYFRLNRVTEFSPIAKPPALAAYAQKLRAKGLGLLSVGISESPYLPLYQAMLLAKRDEIAPESRESFVKSGTQHLFAISGLHIAIIATFMFAILRLLRCPRKWTPAFGLPCLLLYVVVIGHPPSAVRAFIMVASFWSALSFYRRPDPLAALSLSALIVLLWSPLLLWDAGFQLSYGVVLALLLYGLPLADWLNDRSDPYRWWPESSINRLRNSNRQFIRVLIASLSISFSALLGSLFVTGGTFGNVVPAGIFFNLLAIPLASLIVITGATTLLFGWIPGVAYLLNHGAHAGLLILTSFVSLTDVLPEILAPSVAGKNQFFTTLAMVAMPCAFLYGYRKSDLVRFMVPPAMAVLLFLLSLRFV